MPKSNQFEKAPGSSERDSDESDKVSKWSNIADEVPFDPEQAERLQTEEAETQTEEPIPDKPSLQETSPDILAPEDSKQELPEQQEQLEPEQDSKGSGQDGKFPEDFIQEPEKPNPEPSPKKLANMLELKNFLADARENHRSEDDAWEEYWSSHIPPDVSNSITLRTNDPILAFRLDRNLLHKLEYIQSYTPYDDAAKWLKDVESDLQAYAVTVVEGGDFDRTLQNARKIVARNRWNPINRLKSFINKRSSKKR